MRTPVRVVTVLSSAGFVAMFACGSRGPHDEAPFVRVSPSIVFPAGLLDTAASLEVNVYNASDGVSCAAATGRPTGVTATTAKVGSGVLGDTGCVGGARFCGSLTLQKDAGTRVFAAVARSGAGAEIADGCATAIVNQDTLALHIDMVRFVATDVCGDGTIGATEQCEPAATADDFACDASCHSREARLSNPFALAATPSGRVAYGPAFAWTSPGPFFSFFTVKLETDAGAATQVAMRVLSDRFEKLTAPPGISDAAFYLPRDATFPPTASSSSPAQPAAASVGDKVYVAFADDDQGNPDIRLRSFDGAFAGQEGNTPVGINGGPNGAAQLVGEPGIQEAPSIAAGAGGALLVAWQDTSGPSSGKVLARTYTPGRPGVLGSQVEISTGSQNRNVKIASVAGRWVVVWESGADVKLRVVDTNGTPSGGEQTVNEPGLHQGLQEHPAVAALADGRVAVAWSDRGAPGGSDIFVQRYDRNLVKVPGDQAARINTVGVDGEQIAPSIAATSGAGGSFVVAWLDVGSSHVRARLLGGSGGFLFNNVDGQSGDFQASLAPKRTRANPAVASGGAGYVVIGWDDVTDDAASGTYGRRFPLPAQ